ncbi:MAG: hypothetical protein H0Z37_01980 [Firmicutes bacterium]|nr:hypothetical protein [Bacillota bacterium]
MTWDDSRIEAMVQHPGLSGGSRWAEILSARRHFRVAFDAPEGEIGKYLARSSELSEHLAGVFGDDVYVDAHQRALIRDRELNVAVLGRRRELSSWFRESRVFQMLPPLAFLRVYADKRENLLEEVYAEVRSFYR